MRPYYEDKLVTLYHGDCREVVPALGALYDHFISDPPYDRETHAGATTAAKPMEIGFAPVDQSDVMAAAAHASRWRVAFCSLEMLGEYRRLAAARWVRSGFWRRVGGAPQFSGDRPGQPGEGIAIWHGAGTGRMQWNGGGKQAFYEHAVVRGPDRVHKTQKPESLMQEILADFTCAGEVILDAYAGSGTTGVSAKRLGRRCVLVEIDEATCEVAARRLSQQAFEFALEEEPAAGLVWPDLLSVLEEPV